ncbi:MAG: ATP-dependent zinc metalloprotease FtsH [Fimbriiglobus sp.]
MAPSEKPATPPPSRRFNTSLMPGGTAVLVMLLIITVVLLLLNTRKAINVTEFNRLIEAGQVKKFTFVGREKGIGEVRDQNSDLVKSMKLQSAEFEVNLPHVEDQNRYLEIFKTKDAEARKERKKTNPDDNTEEIILVKEDEPTPVILPLLYFFLPLIVFGAFFFFFLWPRIKDPTGGGGFLNNYIRSPAKKYEKSRGRTSFEEVAGMENAKSELQEVVDFLRNPDKFTRLGAQVPKGVLLVGAPGTGKTLLAKAVAGEANVPFFSINGSEFIQMFVGVGASRVRDLFKTAKEVAPCVVFIDEIDAVGRMRGAGVGGGSDEREQTLNQILSEMDGFQPSETVIVLAATNRPDVLDAALLRPGRFDRHVTVDRPTWKGRVAILKVHTKNKPLADTVDLEKIGRNSIGMSGADLRNLCNEAALRATREGKNAIEQEDFLFALDRVLLGALKDDKFSDEEKRRTAYHEAGHALCAWLEPKADPLTRVTIIPRGRSGGVTIFAPNEDRVDFSESECMAKLVVLLGGRAADRIIFGEAMAGAISDLKQATNIARKMVTQFGMSEKLGPVSYRTGEEHVFLGKEIAESRDFSEGTARIIDEEVQRILVSAQDRATHLITQNRADLERIADALLQHEQIDREDLERLLRKGTPETPTEPQSPPPEPTTGGLAFGS